MGEKDKQLDRADRPDSMIVNGEPSKQYASAHIAHYGAHDLSRALHLYDRLIASHPSSPEAAYASTQVRNIVNTVVPKDKFIHSQIELAFAYLKKPRAG